MKIKRHTADLLIIEDRPFLWGLLIIGFAWSLFFVSMTAIADGRFVVGGVFLLAVAVCAILFALVVRRTMVIFNRPAGTVTWRQRTVRSMSEVVHDLRHVAAAEVGYAGSSTSRVELILDGGMDAGRHAVTEVYTSGEGAELAAAAINAWLQLDSKEIRA